MKIAAQSNKLPKDLLKKLQGFGIKTKQPSATTSGKLVQQRSEHQRGWHGSRKHRRKILPASRRNCAKAFALTKNQTEAIETPSNGPRLCLKDQPQRVNCPVIA